MRTRISVCLLAGLAAVGVASGAGSEPVRVERVSGAPVTGTRVVALDAEALTIAGDAGNVAVPLADVITVALANAPDAPRSYAAEDAAVDLASGETVFGRIADGDEHGLTLASPLLGQVRIATERISAVRFLRRLAALPEPPDLRSPETSDVVHLENNDRMACTIEAFGPKAVRVESTNGEKVPVAYDKVTAVRVLGDAPKPPPGTRFVVVLRDGSEVIGTAPATKDGRLSMNGVSGFAVDAALTDVVEAHVVSDRFTYVSDLADAKVEVKPFWKPVAGDPAVLFAPRMDRSFTGRRLTSGGRTWVKGVGCYSGTSITYALGGRYSEFRAGVGLDDGAGTLGGVVFEIEVDGKLRWSSGFVRSAAKTGRGAASPIEVPRVDLTSAKTLTLRVLAGDDEDPWPVGDEADWLGAMLVR